MTNEEIKKILYNYPKINSWIKDYEADLDNIREQLDKHYSVNATVISDMPRGNRDKRQNIGQGYCNRQVKRHL